MPTHAYTIYTDGGSRGNPGPAAAGGVIVGADGSLLAELGEYLGVATNNVAEYRALILMLQKARELGCDPIEVRMDSELVVRQLNGSYRVKDAKMIPLHAQATRLLRGFSASHIRHVTRNENKRADEIVNATLDAQGSLP
ncbi:MAG: ribonuclease HI family protein [Candidatus Eremiobacter antarcticus]